jgi:hypothetical protein
MLLPHPTATSALGSALHIILRNVLRTAAFPMLALATPGGAATFYAPAFGRVWWLALGWSLAEVTAGVVQGYKTIALYRDVLVPEGEAREFIASTVTVTTGALKNGGSDSASSRLRESLSRGEEGGPAVEVAESPVRSREQPQPQPQRQESHRSSLVASSEANDAEIRLEVDNDFDALLALKAREELEELYGIPAIVSCCVFPFDHTYLGIVVCACVCILLAARRVDIAFPRRCLALISRIPHLAPCLAPNCGVWGDDDHSAFAVQRYFLGYFLRRLWGQLGLIHAPYSCALTTCWSARSGVPRILGRVRNVIHRFERLGCLVVR